MGLKETLAGAVTTAIAATGNVAKDISYQRVVVNGYDVTTDTNVSTVTEIVCKGVVYKEKVETQDWKKTDLIQTKVLIAGEVFADNAFVPDEQDFMEIDSVRYEIQNIRIIPSEAGYIFTVRAV